MGRLLVAGLIAALLAALAAGPAGAAPPQKLWELAGFDAPKSVLYDARTDSYFVSSVNGDPLARVPDLGIYRLEAYQSEVAALVDRLVGDMLVEIERW